MKLLVLTTEPLPLPGLPTTGAGLRAWGLGLGLRAAGFGDVQFGFAADAVRGRKVDLSVMPGVRTFERGRLAEFLAEEAPDAVILQHWGLAKDLPALSCPLAIDLAGPHLLERRLWGSRDPQGDLREKIAALARADFVTCSGEFQRHYFLPFLFQAGFQPETTGLCPAIPFSVSPDLPPSPEDRDLSAFLFSGFFLPWQDPRGPISWTIDSLNARDKGRLVIVGGAHPAGDVSGGSHEEFLARLDGAPRVERHGVMPFDELLALAMRCGAAIDLMPRNPERELAFPTRTVFYMWAGLPVIHNNYDELAEPIHRAKAGWTLDPGDERGLKRLVERLAGHSEDIVRRSENARHLVQQRYTWDKTIGPLAAWCRDPHRREGKRPVVVAVKAGKPDTSARAEVSARGGRRRERITYSPPPPITGPNRLQQVLSPLALLVAMPIALLLMVFFGLAEIARMVVKRK